MALPRRPWHVERAVLSPAGGTAARIRRAALLRRAFQHRRDQQHVLRPAPGSSQSGVGPAHAAGLRVLGQALPEVHASGHRVRSQPDWLRRCGRVQGWHRAARRRRQAWSAARAVPITLPRHAGRARAPRLGHADIQGLPARNRAAPTARGATRTAPPVRCWPKAAPPGCTSTSRSSSLRSVNA